MVNVSANSHPSVSSVKLMLKMVIHLFYKLVVLFVVVVVTYYCKSLIRMQKSTHKDEVFKCKPWIVNCMTSVLASVSNRIVGTLMLFVSPKLG